MGSRGREKYRKPFSSMLNPYAVLAGGLPAFCQGHVAAERSRRAPRLAEPGRLARVQGLDREGRLGTVPHQRRRFAFKIRLLSLHDETFFF